MTPPSSLLLRSPLFAETLPGLRYGGSCSRGPGGGRAPSLLRGLPTPPVASLQSQWSWEKQRDRTHMCPQLPRPFCSPPPSPQVSLGVVGRLGSCSQPYPQVPPQSQLAAAPAPPPLFPRWRGAWPRRPHTPTHQSWLSGPLSPPLPGELARAQHSRCCNVPGGTQRPWREAAGPVPSQLTWARPSAARGT